MNTYCVLQERQRYSNPTSQYELEKTLKEEWAKVPLEAIEKLYESILRRIQYIIK